MSDSPDGEGARRLRHVACPVCEARVAEGGSVFPFCSTRCRTIDLGNWLDGRYRLSADSDPDNGMAAVLADGSAEGTQN